jgi:hypothetical protein
MDPLTEFAHWRKPAPYRAEASDWSGRTTVVIPVRSKTGLVAARQGGLAHLDAGVAVIFEDGRARFGARFSCAGGSTDVAILPDASAYGGVCERCVDAVAGPCVYRCFNAAPALIYIGSAEKWLARLSGHRTRTPWWPEVADVKITRYPTIFEARAAERLAIEAENPVHNKLPRRRRAGELRARDAALEALAGA